MTVSFLVRFVVVVGLCAGCTPPEEDDAASLTGVWSWADEADGSGAGSVFITDNGDTLDVVRCGAQDAGAETWTRDGDTVTFADGNRAPGVLDGAAMASSGDGTAWTACRAREADLFGAGSLRVTEGGTTHADLTSDVCAMRTGAAREQVLVAAYVEGAMTLLEVGVEPGADALAPGTAAGLRIDAAGMARTNIDQTSIVPTTNTAEALQTTVQATVLLDGGARSFVWEFDVAFDAPDCG